MLLNRGITPCPDGVWLIREGPTSPATSRTCRHGSRPFRLQQLQPRYRLEDAFPGVIDTGVLPSKRSVRPLMVEEIHIDWRGVFSFLFPDGNILHGSWPSYAIIAFVLAVFIELGTQLLYLLTRGGEIISPKRAEALTRRKALEAAEVQRKERRKELAKQRAVQQRAQQIKAQRSKQDTGDMLRTEGEELEQDLTDKRYIFQDYIAGERVRGLAWLLTYTVLAIWITGVLNKDSPLAP